MRLFSFTQRIKYIFARATANFKNNARKAPVNKRKSVIDPGDLDLICMSGSVDDKKIPATERYIAQKNEATGLYNIGTQAQFDDGSSYQRAAENLTLYEALQFLEFKERAYIKTQTDIPYNPDEIKAVADYNHPFHVKRMLVDFPLSTYFPETEKGAEAQARYQHQRQLKITAQRVVKAAFGMKADLNL